MRNWSQRWWQSIGTPPSPAKGLPSLPPCQALWDSDRSFHTAYPEEERQNSCFQVCSSYCPSRTALTTDTYKKNSEQVSMGSLAMHYRGPSKKQEVYEGPQRQECTVSPYFREVCWLYFREASTKTPAKSSFGLDFFLPSFQMDKQCCRNFKLCSSILATNLRSCWPNTGFLIP